ncbi:MAG: response regulator [Oscillatoriales cyanobacterium SM2_2_1]|nr:response regulator [Oscillatoriales cyanobacterium SM2_2_1]
MDEIEAAVRQMFLEEAQEHLHVLEDHLSVLEPAAADYQSRLNAVLRAAHSLKGGAGLMQLPQLSEAAHRFEEVLKALKNFGPQRDLPQRGLILDGVATLQRLVTLHRQGMESVNCSLTVFAELLEQVRSPDKTDEMESDVLVVSEPEVNLTMLLFETEIESSLATLEALLARNSHPEVIRQELGTVASDLANLGEMLELPEFVASCQMVLARLEGSNGASASLAAEAVRDWRQTQAKVLQPVDSQKLEISQEALFVFPPDLETFENPFAFPIEDREFSLYEVDSSRATELIEPETAETVEDLFADLESGDQQEGEDLAVSLPPVAASLVAAYTKDSSIRLPLPKVEQLSSRITELQVFKGNLDVQLAALRELAAQLRQCFSSEPPEASSSSPYQRAEELSEDLDLLLYDVEQQSAHMGQELRQMGSLMQEVRMRPFGEVTQRFPRMMRNLVTQYDKPVSLELSGTEVLIDRAAAEPLTDALTQLLRNAFDHGIEDVRSRLKQGKSTTGQIELTASQTLDQTVIQVRDDGRGIDLNRLRERAIAAGADREVVAHWRDEQVMALIFEPGFSTAERITGLSGRGVGMDVVRTTVEQLGGRVSVESRVGQGTTFTLSLPRLMAALRVLLVQLGGVTLGIPSDWVQEMVPAVSLSVTTVRWRNQEVAIAQPINLVAVQSSQRHSAKPGNATPCLLILKDPLNGAFLGLPVEGCWGEQEASLHRIEGAIPLPDLFSACVILSDGQAVPLVQMQELFRRSPRRESPMLPVAIAPVEESLPVIVLAEDTASVRRYFSQLFQKHGYRTVAVTNGMEALSKIRSGLPVEVVVTDLEMPELSGYGLLSQLRGDRRFAQLPVIMFTARHEPKYRQLALNLGVSAFLTKPCGDRELLETIAQLREASRRAQNTMEGSNATTMIGGARG